MTGILSIEADYTPYTIVGDDVPESELFAPAEVIERLQWDPKQISCIYYYDDRGSRLFEELCLEPTYYLTRTELKIIEDVAPEIADVVGPSIIAELGCGSGTKSKHLLKAFVDRHHQASYVPIDINRSILVKNAETLLGQLNPVTVHGIVGTYQMGLQHIAGIQQKKCLLFLGSTIGNMEDHEIGALLTLAHSAMNVGDYFLVGLDLDKESSVVEAAYNNQTAILTNLSVLEHLNWRFDGDFDLFRFRHIAFHNTVAKRIESHLEAVETQRVRLAALNFEFEIKKGERIRTEISRKFVEPDFVKLFEKYGLQPVHRWHDQDDLCALHLFRKPPPVSAVR